MKKLLFVTIYLLIALLTMPMTVYADKGEDALGESVENTLDKLDISEIESIGRDNIDDFDALFGGVKEYIRGIVKGDFSISFGDIMSLLSRALFGDIMSFLPIVVTIVSISLLFSIVDKMSSGFASYGTREIIYFVCYIVVILTIITSVGILLHDAIRVTRAMHNIMMSIFPILLTLMASLGGVVSVGAYKPTMAVLTFFVSSVVSKIVIPIFIATMVFSIVGNLSSSIKLDKMTSSIKSVGEFILGIVFSLFTSFVTLQGIVGASIDNVSIKSAKFAISSYVPILGGYISDGFDLAVASAMLIKNSLGFTGIMIVLIMTLAPVIKIAIFSLTLKLTAGIIEPICDNRISSFVFTVAKNMNLLIAILLGLAFMFFIMCMLVILSLNTAI